MPERPRAGFRVVAKISSSGGDTIALDNSTDSKKAKKLSGLNPSPRSIPGTFEDEAGNLRVFELSELRSATNNFSRALKIGEGGFGNVYKGFIRSLDVEGRRDRVTVAIKVFNQKGLQVLILPLLFNSLQLVVYRRIIIIDCRLLCFWQLVLVSLSNLFLIKNYIKN